MALKNVFNKRTLRNGLGVVTTAAGLALAGGAIAGGAFLTLPVSLGLAGYAGFKTAKNWKKQPKP